MHTTEIRKAVVVVLLSVVSCRADQEYDLPDDVVWSSAHFAYHSRTGEQPVCEDIVAKLEQHFASLQRTLGFDWPKGRTIHYYKFPTQEDFVANSPCPAGAAACTDRNRVYSYRVFEQHELVHAYLSPLGVPPPVITEGAAVALACDRALSPTPPLSLADAMRVSNALSDQRVYDTGGRLVRYLLTTYGAESFLRFYSQLGTGSAFDTLDRRMHAVFGAGAEEIWEATLATPVSCPPPFECSRDAVPLDGTVTEVSPTCGLSYDARTFNLTAETEIALMGPAFLFAGSCDSSPFSAIRVTCANPGTPQVGLVKLPQGHYYLDIRSAGPTTVQMATSSFPWAGADCSALQPPVLPAGYHGDLRLSIPPGESEWTVKLRFEDARQFTVRLPPGVTLVACPDCSRSGCQTLGSASDVSWQGDYVLRVQSEGGNQTTAIDLVGR